VPISWNESELLRMIDVYCPTAHLAEFRRVVNGIALPSLAANQVAVICMVKGYHEPFDRRCRKRLGLLFSHEITLTLLVLRAEMCAFSDSVSALLRRRLACRNMIH
jgi:hypothetical protein